MAERAMNLGDSPLYSGGHDAGPDRPVARRMEGIDTVLAEAVTAGERARREPTVALPSARQSQAGCEMWPSAPMRTSP